LDYKKILLIQTAFIGDVILITPLIRAIKELYPDSLLDVMVIPQTADILDNNPNINKLVIFDKRKNKFISFVNTLRIIKKKKYDIAFSPHSSMTTALLMYLAKIPVRVGFDRWQAKNLLTQKVTHPEGEHKIEKNLHLLSLFSDKKFSIETKLFPPKKMSEKASVLLSDLKMNTRKLIAVAPGSVWYTKKWPQKYYKNLVGQLSESGYGIVFIGSPDERKICEEIKPEKNSINLAGDLSLLESAAVIAKCDLMICNDSGALHLANAVKTDVIAFFGPTVKSIGYYPFRDTDYVFEIDMDCRPCSSHGGNKCPLEHFDCMRLIKPDSVFLKVKELLD